MLKVLNGLGLSDYEEAQMSNFDRERMEKALSEDTVELPKGLTTEEKREFISSHTGNTTKVKTVDLQKITNDGCTGNNYWVCDYRRPDLNKKAIRNVPPTYVKVVSNKELPKSKTIYYSNVHLRPILKGNKVSKKIIGIFDSTGYRSYPGVPLNIFETQEECRECYEKQVKEVIDKLIVKRDNAYNEWDIGARKISEYLDKYVAKEEK